MTPGMIILLLLIGWIAIAIFIGRFVYKGTNRRWAQVLTVLFVIWLPFWDVIPGWIMYQKAVREIGGVRIKRTVTAAGYLDHDRINCRDCWGLLKTLPFKYIEVQITTNDPLPRSITGSPGFYQFEFVSAESSQCISLDGVSGEASIRASIPGGQCLVVIRRDAPISRYEKLSGRSSYDGWKLFPTVQLAWNLVRDRSTGETIAEAYRVHYRSWLGDRFMLPQWNYIRSEAGQPLYFRIQDAIRPINGKE